MGGQSSSLSALGIVPTKPVSRQQFHELFDYYDTRSAGYLSRAAAKKFLLDFAAASGVKTSSAQANKLLDDVAQGSRRFSKKQFKRLFFETAKRGRMAMTQSLQQLLDPNGSASFGSDASVIDVDSSSSSLSSDGDDDGMATTAAAAAAVASAGKRRKKKSQKVAEGESAGGGRAPPAAAPTVAAVQEPVPRAMPSAPAASAAPTWFFHDGKQWVEFDRLTQRLLEQSCVNRMRQVLLNHGQWASKSKGGYRVDFGRCLLIQTASGQAQHAVRVPTPSSANYGSGVDGGAAATSATSTAAAAAAAASAKSTAGPASAAASKKSKLSEKSAQCAKLCRWKEIPAGEVESGETCAICMCGLDNEDEDDDLPGWDAGDDCAVRLGQCEGHGFHRECIVNCFNGDWLQCPICGKTYGVRKGIQPNGTMRVTRTAQKLPGHPDGGTIVISYSFPNGTQGPQHPQPGAPYSGTSRTAYLPDNKAGKRALKLLEICWDRRLTFTVGTSVTTGQANCVIWSGIHHKTHTGSGAFGYPDATYLSRLEEECADKGVFVD